jgi:hypothetical protein
MGSCLSKFCPSWPSKSPSSSISCPHDGRSFEGPVRRPSKFRERLASAAKERKRTEEVISKPGAPTEEKRTSNFVNAVYYPNWRVYDGQTPASLNLDNVSHVFYAFAK